MYGIKDMQIFNTNIPKILEKIDNIVLQQYAPTEKEIKSVHAHILKFIQKNKRKLYGGFALNMLLMDKNPKDAFYGKDEQYFEDIDVYSPNPLNDLVELCNLLRDAKYENVYAREALHRGTYSLEVNKRTYCDFSYVPANIYTRMPFVELNNYIIVHPHFMMMDYLKIFIEPISSASFKWKKTFNRYYVLQKNYPFRESNRPLKLTGPMSRPMYELIYNFCANNDSIIVSGFMAYNLYVSVSKINKPYISKLKLPFFELISFDYINDVKKLISVIREQASNVTIIEKYPFFTFTNFSTEIMVNDSCVVKISQILHNWCVTNAKHEGVTYGSFHFNLRQCLINATYERVNKKNKDGVYNDMASHMIQMRQYYFDSHKVNFLDTGIFGDFSSECKGKTVNEKILMKTGSKKSFKYTPGNKKVDLSNWNFPNSSGNQIINPDAFLIRLDDDIHDKKNIKKKK